MFEINGNANRWRSSGTIDIIHMSQKEIETEMTSSSLVTIETEG